MWLALLLNHDFILTKKAEEKRRQDNTKGPCYWPKSPWSGAAQPLTLPRGPCRSLQIIQVLHWQASRYVGMEEEGHFRPWNLCAGFPKPCPNLLFPSAWRLPMPQDIIHQWPPILGWAWCLLLGPLSTHVPRGWSTFMRGPKGEPSTAETPTTCPVYEAANNLLSEMLVTVFYRGLEHLIKDFYLACLILKRSLNCRASKCQCSLNIYIPSSRSKQQKRPRQRESPSCPPSLLQREKFENDVLWLTGLEDRCGSEELSNTCVLWLWWRNLILHIMWHPHRICHTMCGTAKASTCWGPTMYQFPFRT